MGNPPDRLKMLTAGTVDRSTRQTIIATLDRATPGGNHGPGTRPSRESHRVAPRASTRCRPVDRSAPRTAESPADLGQRPHLAVPGVRC